MHDVKIITFKLDCEEMTLGELRRSLSAEELLRMERFATSLLQKRFIVAHGMLRRALGKCLSMPPSVIQFSYGTRKKPLLVNDPNLHFNLSHSGDCGLIAIAKNRAVGVDVEAIREDLDFLSVAQRFFDPSETDWLKGASDTAESRCRFFRLWTLKEAMMKATGEGMHLPPKEIVWRPNEDGQLRLESVRGSRKEATMWEWKEWKIHNAYRAALVAKKFKVFGQ